MHRIFFKMTGVFLTASPAAAAEAKEGDVLRVLRYLFLGKGLDQLDRSIERLKDIRDSYRALNVEIYGENFARLLNDR